MGTDVFGVIFTGRQHTLLLLVMESREYHRFNIKITKGINFSADFPRKKEICSIDRANDGKHSGICLVKRSKLFRME